MIKTPVFDGHNDLLLALWRSNDLDGKDFIFGRQKGHIDPVSYTHLRAHET